MWCSWQLLSGGVLRSCGSVGRWRILRCYRKDSLITLSAAEWPNVDVNNLKLKHLKLKVTVSFHFKCAGEQTWIIKTSLIFLTALCIIYSCCIDYVCTTKAPSCDVQRPQSLRRPARGLKPLENFPCVSPSEQPFDAETVQTHIFHWEIANEVHASKAVSFVTQWSIHRFSQ